MRERQSTETYGKTLCILLCQAMEQRFARYWTGTYKVNRENKWTDGGMKRNTKKSGMVCA